MKTARQTASELETFDDEHGQLILTALTVYAEKMREAAQESHAASQLPELPDPPGDGTAITLRPTPAGYERMATMFTEAADSAKQAYAAYEKLTGRADEQENPS